MNNIDLLLLVFMIWSSLYCIIILSTSVIDVVMLHYNMGITA